MNNVNKLKKFVLIVIFAIIFSNSVTSGIRAVIVRLLEIPDNLITFTQWGDTFFLHIFASLIGTATGAFVVGTFLKNKTRLAAIVATFPIVVFWLVALVFNVTNGHALENIKVFLLLPGFLIILSPIIGYFGAGWGQIYSNNFQRSKSILDIKWYHWLWILQFYLTPVVAVLLFMLLLLWRFDASSSSSDSVMISLISAPGETISRIIVFFILAGLVTSVGYVYTLLIQEETTTKLNFKNGIIIFGHVLLFFILFYLLLIFPGMKQYE